MSDTDHTPEQCDYPSCQAHQPCTCPYASTMPHTKAGCRYFAGPGPAKHATDRLRRTRDTEEDP